MKSFEPKLRIEHIKNKEFSKSRRYHLQDTSTRMKSTEPRLSVAHIKNKEFSKSRRYYLQDTYCTDRTDSAFPQMKI